MKLGLGLQWTIKDRCKWFKFVSLRVIAEDTCLVFSEKKISYEKTICVWIEDQPNCCCQ